MGTLVRDVPEVSFRPCVHKKVHSYSITVASACSKGEEKGICLAREEEIIGLSDNHPAQHGPWVRDARVYIPAIVSGVVLPFNDVFTPSALSSLKLCPFTPHL
jgi:hypothetical protein